MDSVPRTLTSGMVLWFCLGYSQPRWTWRAPNPEEKRAQMGQDLPSPIVHMEGDIPVWIISLLNFRTDC